MDLVDDWLADRIGRVRPGLLVLARTRALVVRTRRWLGDRQLGLGVDVLTPAGLAERLAAKKREMAALCEEIMEDPRYYELRNQALDFLYNRFAHDEDEAA